MVKDQVINRSVCKIFLQNQPCRINIYKHHPPIFSKNCCILGPYLQFINNPAVNNKTIIAIFASGAGSNAHNIIQYFKGSNTIDIGLIVCNKPGAGVLGIAQSHQIPTLLIEKERFYNGDAYLPVLQQYQIGFIVLAGFLWKVPQLLVSEYHHKIVNIHPALLPKFGGKGMYGDKVHQAVLMAGEIESGITIHLVNELYDEGAIVFAASCPVERGDTAQTLANKIHTLEYAHYPRIIEQLVVQSR